MFKKIKNILDDKNLRVILGNFLSLIVLRGFDFLIPLITLPYIVSIIGIEKFGLVNFALAFSVYFSAVIQYGFSVTSTRDIARNRDSKAELESIYSVTMTSSLYLISICVLLYVAIVLSIDKLSINQELYFMTFISMALKSIFPIWVFQGMERMKYITYLSLLSKLIFVVSLFIFVKEEADYIVLPILNATSSLVILISAIILIRVEFKINCKLKGFNDVIKHLKYGRHAFISQFAPNLYSNTAVFALGLFTNNSVVGIFTAASKVIDVVASLAYIFSNTFFPYISRNIEKHNFFRNMMLAIGAILTTSTIIFSDFIVSILFNNVDGNISFNIKILSPVIILIFMQLTFGTNFLMLIGKDYIAKNVMLSVSVLSLLYSIPSIFLFGINGAIFTLVFTRILVLSCYFYYYTKFRG